MDKKPVFVPFNLASIVSFIGIVFCIYFSIAEKIGFFTLAPLILLFGLIFFISMFKTDNVVSLQHFPKMPQFRFAPLSGGYMAVSMIGLIISIYYITNPSFNIGSIFLIGFIFVFMYGFFRKDPSSFEYVIIAVVGMIASIMVSFTPSLTLGYTFAVFFGIMFFASIISMTVADPDEFVELETRAKKK